MKHLVALMMLVVPVLAFSMDNKAESFLDKWYFWATHSRIPAIIDVAKTIRRHQYGILRWFVSGINNAILEGINSLVQAAKAKARGYRSDRNLATIIYLIAGCHTDGDGWF